MAALDFRFEHGAVYFPALRLWLDAHRPMGPGDLVFVSHAHSDHTAAHARVLFSPPTQKLMRARVSGQRTEHVLEFGRRYTATEAGLAGGDVRITLLPAGHILGSAMIRIESGDTSLLYTGDFKLRPGLSAEPCEPCAADVLIMETTYGRPMYAFPPTTDILERIVHFCVESLDNDETPVLLGYSLGKSQEILSGLAGAGLPIALSEPAAKLTAVYEALGRTFPPHEVLDLGRAAGKVVLAPPGMAVSRLRRRLGPCRVAVLTGWSVDPGCRFRYQADAAFPLSDHADFPDLVAFVRQVRPQSVFTLHGFAADFAGHLRTLGVAARALSETEQLELGLVAGAITEATASVAIPVAAKAPLSNPASTPAVPDPGSFAAFAAACESIRSTRAKSEKTQRLAVYLAGVPADALAPVTAWMSGGSLTSTGRPVSAGWSVLRQAIARAAGVSDAEFRAWYLRYSDTGDTAAALLQGRADAGESPLSWKDVAALWNRLAETSVAAEKVDHLA
ncbi:MAG: MBL fold metallo-hydrolase, partial [Verrucomicrobia bacterium]|nr:MBL fold metallo-hydrolase [Verrucomicrobiota bacterium]